MNWKLLSGGTIATLAGLKIYSDRTVRQAKAEVPPAGQFIRVDGTRLHYLAKGSGQTVVLLHGSGVVLQDFILSSIFDQVAAESQAIAFDRPGYGYSERPAGQPLTPALNARLIHEALQQLEISKPILVGHSYGGAVALRYALEYPDEVAGLVLLAPAAYAQGLSVPPMFYIPDIPGVGPIFLHTLGALLWRAITPQFVAGIFAPDPPPDMYIETMEAFTIRPDQFRAFADEVKSLQADLREQSPRYGEIRVPVMIIASEDDPIDYPKDQSYPLHHTISHSQLLMLKNTGHAFHHKYPEMVMNAVRQLSLKEQVS